MPGNWQVQFLGGRKLPCVQKYNKMQITRKETYELIWNQMQNSKFKEFYIGYLIEKYQKRERLLNIFLVIVTSSSISAWAIWEVNILKWVWAVIIAISQIISLIKPYLNVSNRAGTGEKMRWVYFLF